MDERPDRPSTAVSVPMTSGTGMSPSFGVAAPIGAVSRKDRERARATSLRREGTSTVLLLTALPGSVSLQRRTADGGWETVDRRRAWRPGRTRLDLPPGPAAARPTYRVVFAPRNADLTSWISEDLGG